MGVPKILSAAKTLVRSRAKEIFGWLWVTTVSCLIVSRGSPPLSPFIMTVAAMFFISASVYIFNDVIDVEFDKSNPIKMNRPLPSGQVKIEDAKKMVYIFGLFGVLMFLLVNIVSFILSLIHFTLLILYSHPKFYLKRIMIVKEGIITFGIIIASLVGSYAVINSFSLNAFFASIIFAIFVFTAQPAMADTVDIEQDSIFGVKTMASVMSWKRKMQLLITGILIIMTLTPLTYVYLSYNFLLPIFVVLGGLVFLRYMFPIMNTLEQANMLRAIRISWVFYFMIQTFYIIGSLKIPSII